MKIHKRTKKRVTRLQALLCILISLLFATGLIYIWKNSAIYATLFPPAVSLTDNDLSLLSGRYITLEDLTLYPAGIDHASESNSKASYYYTILDDTCYFFLLTETASAPDALTVSSITGTLSREWSDLDELTSHTAATLSWTTEALKDMTSPYLFTDITYTPTPARLFTALTFAALLAILFYIVKSLIYLLKPALPPAQL